MSGKLSNGIVLGPGDPADLSRDMTEMHNMGEHLQDVYLALNQEYQDVANGFRDQEVSSAFPELHRTSSAGYQKSSDTRKQSAVMQALKDFADSTTFHGFSHVFKSDAFIGRRLLWLLLLCICSGLLIFQVVDRILYYYDWPVTVNVRINYNKTMRFPSVTICNQNAFKATTAAELHQYRLLEAMYSGAGTFNADDLIKYGAENITLDELFLQTAHKRKDLIRKCYWKGETCSYEDFTVSVTDHGVCFTFNKGTLDEYISSPGVENGLRLTLNVEQYEYMPGPHEAAGVKMLLHEPDEVPTVHALGQAVSTGSHVFVGVKVLQVENRPKPHGTCSAKDLHYAKTFSVSSCHMDCITVLAEKTCGCRHSYMLHKDGSPKVCSLHKYYGCLKELIATVPLLDETVCKCPIPCSFQMFEPDISYASTSQYAVQKYVNANESDALLQDLIKAKEVTSRMEEFEFQRMVTLTSNFGSTLNEISQIITVNLSDIVSQLMESTSTYSSSMTDLYTYKEFLMRYQIYIVQKNFIRPRDAMEERIIHIVTLAYVEYILTIENRIRTLADPEFNDTSARNVIRLNTLEMLTNRQIIVSNTYDNYTQLKTAYDTGTPIFNYKFESLSRASNIPATPKLLIMEASTHNDYAIKYGERFGIYLNKTLERLDWLMDLVDVAYYNKTLDEARMFYCREQFRYYMRNFAFAKSVFYYETIEWPVGILQNKLDAFRKLWLEHASMVENIEQSLRSIQQDISAIQENVLAPLHDLYKDIEYYVKFENQTKIQISNTLISQSVQDGITKLKAFFQQLRTREANLLDWSVRLEDDALQIWKTVVEDEDSMGYYNYTKRYDLMQNYTDVEPEVKEKFTTYRELCQLSSVVNNKDTLFLNALESLVDHAREYNESIKIDSAFIAKNFLQLDIFYRQMSFQEITQQIAYDSFSLICDIGGSMGIFLGASALSLFEIIDLICHHLYAKTKTTLTSQTIHVKPKQDAYS